MTTYTWQIEIANNYPQNCSNRLEVMLILLPTWVGHRAAMKQLQEEADYRGDDSECFDCPGCPCPSCAIHGWDADTPIQDVELDWEDDELPPMPEDDDDVPF